MFLEVSGNNIIITPNPSKNTQFLMIPKLKTENK